MIAIDTNVLVRYLVKDDPKQARKAKALVNQLDENDERAYISDIVICELAWVLRGRYGFSRPDIAQTLTQLTAARQLVFSSPDNTLRAIKAYENGSGDFADYLIREHAKAANCDSVVTFDKKLLKEESFTSP
jgi:predicted nucleic-acid-binding protein